MKGSKNYNCLRVGSTQLRLDTVQLTSPRGDIRLSQPYFKFLRLIMEASPGPVEDGKLIQEIWPEPDREPDYAEKALRVMATSIRGTMAILGMAGGSSCRIIREQKIGYRFITHSKVVRELVDD